MNFDPLCSSVFIGGCILGLGAGFYPDHPSIFATLIVGFACA